MSSREAVVYVVEDDASFRRSLERLLQGSGWRVKTFGRAAEFLNQTSLEHPSCLLLDVCLPDIDGMALPEHLEQRNIRLPIVFMTGHGSIPMGVAAMKRGAVDFLPKPFESTELIAALREALARDEREQNEALEKHRAQSLIHSLTPRETEVMRGIIAGRLNKQIAVAMGISEKTVKVHRGRVMQKTRAGSVADLVRLAEIAGLSPLEP